MKPLPTDSCWAFTTDSVSDPEIRTDIPQPGPEIRIEFEVGNSDSCSGNVFVELYDTGHKTRDRKPLFDATVSTDNGDNVPLFAQALMVQVALQKFYHLGLNTKFGELIGE